MVSEADALAMGSPPGCTQTAASREASSARELELCEPVYRSFKGWDERLEEARVFEDLPDPARDYVSWIEDALEVPASLIGVGPERDATIERANPFDTPPRT